MASERMETERLVLRPLTVDDAQAVFTWCGDPAVNRYMTYPLYRRVEDVRAWLTTTQQSVEAGRFDFGFVRKADGLLIGCGGLYRDGDGWDVGYNLRRDCWGMGYATEAARAMIAFAHDRLGVCQFTARHATANVASGHVLEKCGFVFDHAGNYARLDGSETFPARYYRLCLGESRAAVAHPFPPVVCAASRVLILGSFPSVRSREEGFFYGHPQNRFWPMLAAIYGEETPRTIDGKRALILRHGLALWDVIASCRVTGSSDASVRDAVPVDIRRVTDTAPIMAVLCNGALAAKLYAKHLQPLTGIPARTMPSTSPANAAWGMARLMEAWRAALKEE